MQRKILGVVIAGLLVCGVARAEDEGFYAGAGLGRATQSSGVFDGEDTSWRLFAGYSFGKYLAVEGGFVDGGAQEDTIGALDVTSDNKGVFISLIGQWPIGERFTPYAKIGLVSYESTTTLSNGAASISESERDEDLSFGGGLEFKANDRFSLRADYEKVRVPDVAYDIYTLMGVYRF